MEAGTFGRSRRGGSDTAIKVPGRSPREKKAHTIGAVCKLLKDEFSDISISKIRYLEDQGLLAPRRTQGGYRLYSQADVARLRTILRLQRDEFLPLRVIRQELAAGRAAEEADDQGSQRQISLTGPAQQLGIGELVDTTGVDPDLVGELEEFGLLRARGDGGSRTYDNVDREIVIAASELRRYGVAARNLRVFRTSAEREAGLLEQVLGAALRSPNSEKRREAIESLESLAAVVARLQHLLLVRDLRKLTG